jgi:CRP-like cAMP-binding protein
MANTVELQTTSRERRIAIPVRSGRAGQYLVHAGSRPDEIFRLERGWAIQFRFLPDGRRHIIDYFVAGDWCDISWLTGDNAVDAVRAVTDFSATPFCADRARGMIASHQALTLQVQSMLSRRLRLQTERALGLGRKTATERLAHLLCEISARMEAAGLVEDGQCVMPLTQTDLADLSGLTPIHVNRVLQQLRAAEMIGLSAKRLTIVSPERLQRLAMFCGDYLVQPTKLDLGVA